VLARSWLEDARAVTVIRAATPYSGDIELPEDVEELFGRYEEIHIRHPAIYLARNVISRLPGNENLVRIGISQEFEIAVDSRNGQCFDVELPAREMDRNLVSQSVYHWIAVTCDTYFPHLRT
jgi:hypothetical protein